MKKIILAVIFTLFATQALAMRVGKFNFKSQWSGINKLEGYKMIIVGVVDHGFTGDKVVIIKPNGMINYFSLFSSPNFYTDTNSKFSGLGEYFKIDGRVLRKNQLIAATISPSYGTKSEAGLFERNYDKFDHFNETEIIAELEKRFVSVGTDEEVSSIKSFKKVLIRLKDTMGYITPDEFELLYFVPFQQEQEWEFSLPNGALRNVDLNSSELVKKFRDAGSWTNAARVGESKDKVISYVRKNSSFALGNGVLGLKVKNFVQYEIVNRHYFNCGKERYWTESTTWLLNDGSYFKYVPTSECQY